VKLFCISIRGYITAANTSAAVSTWTGTFRSSRQVLHAGATVQVGINPSKVIITKLRLDKDRKKLLERKKGSAAKAADPNKMLEQDTETMENID
jgi:hypothetical protein